MCMINDPSGCLTESRKLYIPRLHHISSSSPPPQTNSPINHPPRLLAHIRQRTHRRITRRQMTHLPRSPSKASIRVLARSQRLDHALLPRLIELSFEQAQRVESPVQDPRARGV